MTVGNQFTKNTEAGVKIGKILNCKSKEVISWNGTYIIMILTETK